MLCKLVEKLPRHVVEAHTIWFEQQFNALDLEQ